MAVMVGLLDRAVNVIGDLCDLPFDRAAGLRTLPVLWGSGATLTVSSALMPVGLTNGLWTVGDARSVVLGLAGAAAVLIAVTRAPRRWQYGVAHGPKLMAIAFIGAGLADVPPSRIVGPAAGLGIAWLAGYAAYVRSQSTPGDLP